jgi:nitroreductase/FMN reductase (NADPH)/FMN reductase [NAD(P)H]
MNEVMKQLYERKSMRVFEDKEIAAEDKAMILEAAAMAPSAGNQQLYTILDITDEDIKKRLVDSCDHQPFIATGKMVLIICADCQKWYEAFKTAGCQPRDPGPGDLLLAIDDALIAAQNAVVAAQSYGIGSCYIGDIMENAETQRKLLGLPEYVFPAAMLVFGYPTQQQVERVKPVRCDWKHIVHENAYRTMDGEELREMFASKHPNLTYEEWCQRFCNRKYNSDFSKEMTRSVGVYMDQYEKEY